MTSFGRWFIIIGLLYSVLITNNPTTAWRSGMASFVYFSVPTKDLAEKIGRTLIEEKAVSCLNILPDATAIFPVDGEIKAEAHVLVIGKTRTSRVSDFVEIVKKMHPDSMPDIVTTPIRNGNELFLDWTLSVVPDHDKSCIPNATKTQKPKAAKSRKSKKPAYGEKKTENEGDQGDAGNDNQPEYNADGGDDV